MMWPSQNFLLYIGAIMLMIKKEKFKLVWQSPSTFGMHVPCINYNNLISKKNRRF